MVAKDKCHGGKKIWSQAFSYIRNHPEIRDVIISGGDPLTMTDSNVAYILSELRSIPSVEIIRIGTKVPVVLPQRINKSLLSILKRFQPLYLSIHFTHPYELTPEVQMACNSMADAGIPLGSQTVLLKNINDDVDIMRKLMQGLLRIRVRPYHRARGWDETAEVTNMAGERVTVLRHSPPFPEATNTYQDNSHGLTTIILGPDGKFSLAGFDVYMIP